MQIEQDSARVRIPPPLYLVTSIVLGVGLQFFYPIHLFSGIVRWVLGGVLLSGGLGVILYCAWMFRKAKTAIEPWKTTSNIVTSGPYRYSRNPIYLSFVLLGLGIASLLDNLWIALMQALLVVVITHWVIQKEEQYLEQKFGEKYREYKNQVRRWI